MKRMMMRWLCVIFIMVGVGIQIVSAQGEPTPIALGENKIGQVEPNGIAQFTLTINTPQTVTVQLLGVSEGFAAGFAVYDALDLLIVDVPNDAGATVVQSVATLSTPGSYLIEVTGISGLGGQFLLSVQSAGAIEPASDLPLDLPIDDSVSQTNPRSAFAFFGDPTSILLLTARSGGSSSPTFLIRDNVTNALLGASSARLAGGTFRIPAGIGDYLLEVLHGGGATVETFSVCLSREGAASPCQTGQTGGGGTSSVDEPAIPTLSASVPTQVPPPTLPSVPQATFTPVIVTNPPTAIILPTLPSNLGCVIAPASATTVNVRSAPSLDANVIAQLPFNQYATVIGRLSDNSWYQVSYSGLFGWISASVARLGGDCGGVLVISPTLTPTQLTPVSATPTITLTPSFTPTPTTGGTLNYSLPALFGSTALVAGFIPDPFTTGITAGGPVNASYLGGACRGYTTSAPSFSVSYTSGAFPMLRFYFIGGGDTTMIINTPSGNYVCIDDSFNTVDPTLDFNNPSTGRYDIWIATYSQGASIGGTLYVTESTANHP